MAILASTMLPEALVLDVPEIDSQHEDIFFQIESLKESCLESNALPVAAIDRLLASLVTHFATEERLAREAGIYFSDHEQQHRDSLAAIKRATHGVQQGTRDVFCLLRYLECWFERHITDADRPLAERLNRTPAFRPVRPDAAREFRRLVA